MWRVYLFLLLYWGNGTAQQSRHLTVITWWEIQKENSVHINPSPHLPTDTHTVSPHACTTQYHRCHTKQNQQLEAHMKAESIAKYIPSYHIYSWSIVIVSVAAAAVLLDHRSICFLLLYWQCLMSVGDFPNATLPLLKWQLYGRCQNLYYLLVAWICIELNLYFLIQTHLLNVTPALS